MKAAKVILFLIYSLPLSGQAIDHWEAAILAEELWHYRPGGNDLPDNWQQPEFEDGGWLLGEGGFGYGDGDDNTVIAPTLSLYLRKEFTVVDKSQLAAVSLYADYDDAFVAYLNGVEIARANIGTPGVVPAYDATSVTDREALLYQGGQPEMYQLSSAEIDELLQDGTNTLAIQVHNVGEGSSDFSALFYLLFGLADASNNYQALPYWFIPPFTSSNLPLLLINTNGENIPDEPKIDALLGIVDNGLGNPNLLTDPPNGYNGHIGIELRGSSSLFFAKKGYSMETRDADGDNNNVPLLGLPQENDWVLHGPYSDKSLMRNVLSYHIGNQMDRYTPRTRWCELFINDQYQGVYVLTEKIKRDDNRVDIANLREEDIEGDELTGGYIFSIDRDEQGPESGWYSPFTEGVFYKFQDPDFDELVQIQKDYISDHFTSFETAMDIIPSAAIYEQYLDIPSWIDYWIATEIFKHIDNYRLSFYLYKRKDSNGGKIHFGPLWDLNLAYANFDYGEDPGPEGWSYVWANSGILRPFWIIDLSEDPAIQDQINCRWQNLRQAGLHTDSLLQFIDDQAALLNEAQARNFNRWPVLGTYVWPNSFIGNTYAEEVDFLKDWLSDRLEWMDQNMIGSCTPSSVNNLDEQSTQLKISPNPFRHYLTFELEGTFTPSAQLVLTDALGREVLERELIRRHPLTLSLPRLAPGIYFYRLSVDGQQLETGILVRE